jgi:hypothetical protein
MRKFNARDLYDLYIKIASYVRYHGIIDEESIYPRVVIKLTVRSPNVLAELHFDEDDFRNWLMNKKVSEIIDIAKRDPEFSDWLASDPVILEAVTEGANKTFEEAFSKFEDSPEVYLDLGNAVLQETAKEIYLALVRLAKGGDKEAARILRQADPFINSYAFYRRLPLGRVDEATATIYSQQGPIEINLKDAGAFKKVKRIVEQEILDLAEEAAEYASPYDDL